MRQKRLLALIALARKLLVTLNAIARDQRPSMPDNQLTTHLPDSLAGAGLPG